MHATLYWPGGLVYVRYFCCIRIRIRLRANRQYPSPSRTFRRDAKGTVACNSRQQPERATKRAQSTALRTAIDAGPRRDSDGKRNRLTPTEVGRRAHPSTDRNRDL